MKDYLLLSLSSVAALLIAVGLKSDKNYYRVRDNVPSKFLILTTLVYFALGWLILNPLGEALGGRSVAALIISAIITGLLFLSEIALAIVIMVVRMIARLLTAVIKKKMPVDDEASNRKLAYSLNFVFSFLAVIAITVWSYAAADESRIIAILPIVIFFLTIMYIDWDPFFPLSFHPFLLLVILVLLGLWISDGLKFIRLRKKALDVW